MLVPTLQQAEIWPIDRFVPYIRNLGSDPLRRMDPSSGKCLQADGEPISDAGSDSALNRQVGEADQNGGWPERTRESATRGCQDSYDPALVMNFGLSSGSGLSDQDELRGVGELLAKRNQLEGPRSGPTIDVLGPGSILKDQNWTPLLNDTYILAGVQIIIGRQSRACSTGEAHLQSAREACFADQSGLPPEAGSMGPERCSLRPHHPGTGIARVWFLSPTESIDTRTERRRSFCCTCLPHWERGLIRERVCAGMRAAKANGTRPSLHRRVFRPTRHPQCERLRLSNSLIRPIRWSGLTLTGSDHILRDHRLAGCLPSIGNHNGFQR